MDKRHGFTLLELLVVVGIVATLSTAVILAINPAALLQEARDATRVSDMSTLNKAVSLYYQDAMANPNTMFMGTSSVIYVSIPDPAATSSAGSDCAGLGLPAMSWQYHCAASSTYMNTDGTGWIPINFNSYSAGSVIPRLPVDPSNNTSSLLYYAYATDGSTYEITAPWESQKYSKQAFLSSSPDPIRQAVGTNPSFVSAVEGLMGYWNFDEGAGTTVNNSVDSATNGTWMYGGASSTSGYYAPGKVGSWAGSFDGANNYVLGPTNSFSRGTVKTTAMWVYLTGPSSNETLVRVGGYETVTLNGQTSITVQLINSSRVTVTAVSTGFTFPLNTWTFLATTYDGRYEKIYINGALNTTVGGTISLSGSGLLIGSYSSGAGSNLFSGRLDDVRFYSRALSAAEIQNLYNAGK